MAVTLRELLNKHPIPEEELDRPSEGVALMIIYSDNSYDFTQIGDINVKGLAVIKKVTLDPNITVH